MAQHYFDDCKNCGTRNMYQIKDIVEDDDDVVIICQKCGYDVLPCGMCKDGSECHEFQCYHTRLESFRRKKKVDTYVEWCNECYTETYYRVDEVDRSTVKIKCCGCGREMETCDMCVEYHKDCRKCAAYSCAVLRAEALEDALGVPEGSISAPEED